MAIINCPECNKEISDKAPSCPGCGAPIQVADSPKNGDIVPYSDQEVHVLLSKKKKTSHLLHLVLSVITAGFWLPVWLIVVISNNNENTKIDKKIATGKKVKRELTPEEAGLI